jgi:hypothetical protein
MTQSRQETYDWYDEADGLEAPRGGDRVLPGIPSAWQHFGWWIAGVAFSVLWILETWMAAAPGQYFVGSLAESIWTLLLSLAICIGIYRFSKAQSRPLAQVMCIVSAIVLLLNHALA